MKRRDVLRGAVPALAGVAVAEGLVDGLAPEAAEAAEGRGAKAARILRERAPENWESPFSELDSFITPTEQHYIRSHFAVPAVNREEWKLRVEGAVERPLELTLAELLKLPSKEAPITLECAGNGRIFLQPTARGVQWENGGVSTARWSGVPLSSVLERAGIKASAVDVVFEGADGGPSSNDLRPAGPVLKYARSLPRSRALAGDVLLAYQMNGQPLLPAHGAPVRLMVPGWYGMASVKWLTRILVTEYPADLFWETVDYAIWSRRDGLPVRVPITEMQVKAAISRPVIQEVVPAGKPYRVRGAAWTGNAEISKVELSADGGATWAEAKLQGRAQEHAWRLWDWEWRVPASAGSHVLMAKATDSKGRTQPMERDPDRGTYVINHVVPIPVTVK